ncbi:MAG: hypothetical protein LBV30_08680 [Propionibacteriaceae bacterium]|jgi:hypothetical protein|nr:hypothetical protein [Propionibacteriaceae bacterium]
MAIAMVLAAIVTGVLAFLNYLWQASANLTPALQIISVLISLALTVITIIAAIVYNGRRLRPSFDGGWYSIWTLRYGIIMLSLLGNLSVLVVLALHLFGVIRHL